MIHEKTAGYAPKPDRPALRLKDCIRCARCGEALHRLAGKGHRKDMLYLKCVRCAAMVTIADAGLLDEVARQWAKHKASRQEPYQPSSEVIRLTNAINRGLEHPESPEEVVSLILQGASARYDCCAPRQLHMRMQTVRWMWISTASGRRSLLSPYRQTTRWRLFSNRPPGKDWK